MAKKRKSNRGSLEEVFEKQLKKAEKAIVSIEELTDEQKAELAKSEKRIAAHEELKKATALVAQEKYALVQAELELRKYVRAGGGFRVGISKADRTRTEFLMKRLGRSEPKWDVKLLL